MNSNRHSDEGRNPVRSKNPRAAGQKTEVVCCAALYFWLDSDLRRNDGLGKEQTT